ncbi:UbiH/UbiF/VisC/COQ6 family ubiquinone biosynthesis hydroxylase [Noviherbaspirillum cavernae]|uniref:UbiH/UbiF/VisC/COQ6 family ubiquinone biosynthesis hydroxylase n=1 Tax=Noviherbaspirillum cavernae TaxID=2320862 RepID=A0A418X3Q5_9BURK|nr:UbiH/UbiF/VisC/COQ6 family ubiquinone biosynthesis hydroxylase [Noviherbaspirillum cavernae]RJG07090.1 UbiH/UbiF/VisC/COQ6 family ubiquinone biosynthesis hydroxylase [Noviherbaspirillum cavernae]
MTTDFDIAICGAGPVGLTLALLLVRRGMTAERIALLDAKTVEQAVTDPRSIALSYGSRQILEDIDAWPLTADAIHQIHVSRRGHFGRTLIDRSDYDLPALGYVTRYGVLVNALAAAVARTQIAVIRPAQVMGADEREEHVELQLADEKTINAQIMVQAEGGLFSEQNAKALQRDYGQNAIVAHVRTSAPLMHRAFERFTEEGPLALLPQDDGFALVWCARPASTDRLMALPNAAFLTELQNAFGSRLGRFISASPRNVFPLGLNANPATSARTTAIGNAAQTLHPVAGQGLNLGLRDAAVLARLLAQEATPAALEHFAMRRKTDRNLTIRLTDTMARIFSSAPDGAPSQTLLGMSLGLIDAFTPAKRLLAEQMMFGQR